MGSTFKKSGVDGRREILIHSSP